MFEVFYDENGAYMDPEARSKHGVYATSEAALVECRRIVEADLREQYQPGMTAEALVAAWRTWGRDPFIISREDSPGTRFSAWEYASETAPTIVGGRDGEWPVE